MGAGGNTVTSEQKWVRFPWFQRLWGDSTLSAHVQLQICKSAKPFADSAAAFKIRNGKLVGNDHSLSFSKLFFNEGNILQEGQTLHWPALIETLQAVAENGADEFYAGKTAEKLVEDVTKEGRELRCLLTSRVALLKFLPSTLPSSLSLASPPKAQSSGIFHNECRNAHSSTSLRFATQVRLSHIHLESL